MNYKCISYFFQTEEEFEIEPNSNVVKLKRKVSSLFKTKPALRPILKKPKSWPASSNHQQTNHKTNINDHSINFEESEKLKLTQNQSAPQHQLQQDAKPAAKYLHHLKGTKKFHRKKYIFFLVYDI